MAGFEGRTAIVTGGANGIGRALAEALARAGANVTLTDIDDGPGKAVAAGITASGGRALYRHVDVTDEASVRALVQDTATQCGGLDYLFNNAGIAVAGDSRDLDLDHWRRVTDVNYWGVVYGSKFAYDLMAARGTGHIVNIASLAGLIPFPTNLPYSATKHAVVGLSLSLRAEGADLGVNVSVACPGYIDSNIFSATEIVNAPRTDIARRIPFRLVDVNVAAQRILAGVARNRSVICFPGYARMFWALYRMNRSLLNPLSLKTIREWRAHRRSG